MGQDVSQIPNISIGDYTLEVVDTFTYLGSIIASNLSLDAELNSRIDKAATIMALLVRRVWDNSMLTIKTKMKVSQACVLSTLLYSSETWTLYSHQGSRLNAFHPSCLIQILGITLHNHVPNKNVLAQTRIPSMLALLAQRRLRWLGHLSRMEDGRIPKEMLYGELATGYSAAFLNEYSTNKVTCWTSGQAGRVCTVTASSMLCCFHIQPETPLDLFS